MSMSFEQPLNEKQQSMIKELLGDRVKAIDEKLALFEGPIHQNEMKEIANETNQVVTVEINKGNDIKTMGDGTQYKVTKNGWRKIF